MNGEYSGVDLEQPPHALGRGDGQIGGHVEHAVEAGVAADRVVDRQHDQVEHTIAVDVHERRRAALVLPEGPGR